MNDSDLLRLGMAVAAAFAGYLALVVGTAAAAAACGSAQRWHQVLSATPAPLRRMVATAASACSLVMVSPVGAEQPEPPTGFTIRSEDTAVPPESPPAAHHPPVATTPSLTELTPTPIPLPTPTPTSTQWTVAAGQHLWSIAEATMAAAGRSTDDASVGRYWSRVVAANRHQLADPDLLHPGDVVALPPLPALSADGR